MEKLTLEEKFIIKIHSAIKRIEKDIQKRQIHLGFIAIRNEERAANKVVGTRRSKQAK